MCITTLAHTIGCKRYDCNGCVEYDQAEIDRYNAHMNYKPEPIEWIPETPVSPKEIEKHGRFAEELNRRYKPI